MISEGAGPPGPGTIKASDFTAKCLKLMNEAAKSDEEIVITKNGSPMSRLLPYREKPTSWFGQDRDIIQITGDIIGPIDVEWEAQSDSDRVRREDRFRGGNSSGKTYVLLVIVCPQSRLRRVLVQKTSRASGRIHRHLPL